MALADDGADPVEVGPEEVEVGLEEIALDQRGERCPMPIVALGRAAMSARAGSIIAVSCTDPGAEYDVPAWCQMKGATYLGQTAEPDGATTYRVLLPQPPETNRPAETD